MDCQAQSFIDRLTTLEARLERRRKLFNTFQLTTSQPYVVDFQNRLHLYIMPSAVTIFSCEDMGTLFLPSGRWTEIFYPEGTKITPNTSCTLFVLATDEIIVPKITPTNFVESGVVGGNEFVVTTGAITAGSSNTFGAGLWYAANHSRNVYIHSCKLSNSGGSSMGYLYVPTAAQAMGNAMTATNANQGMTQSSQGAGTYATSAASVSGNLLETAMVPQSQVTELLTAGIFIPAGIAGGLTCYDYIANAASWTVTFRVMEY